MKGGLTFLCAFYGLLNLSINAQSKVNMNFESKIIVSSRDNLLPMYEYSNTWGIISPFEQVQELVLGGIRYKFLDKKKIQLQTGISAIGKNKIDESFLHEIYLKGQFFNLIDFSIGKQAFTYISIDDKLTTGGFLMNSNARPIPRAMIGIFDYWSVSFLADLIEIKGGLSHGVLNDDRTSTDRNNSADNVFIHEKWAYVRLGKIKVKPYIGLFHGALYGGVRSNGNGIPKDFWATFFASGSNKIGGSEASNAAGAHDGFWDIGINYKSLSGNFHLYVHKPYADGTGLKINKERNRDYKLGIYVNLKKTKLIKDISLELIKTDYQSGSGLPEPLYPKGHEKEGQIIFVNDIQDYDTFMLETFDEETEGYTSWHLMRYLEKTQNHGQKYGSRDDYNNNGMYYNGWTYYNQVMGLPLYHTVWQGEQYINNLIDDKNVSIINNRIKGVHVGISGELLSGFKYILKTTYTINKGTYGGYYLSRDRSWDKTKNYYYNEGKKQVYTYLGFDYKSKKWKGVSFLGSISYDFGELYSAFGCSLGISYSPSINF